MHPQKNILMGLPEGKRVWEKLDGFLRAKLMVLDVPLISGWEKLPGLVNSTKYRIIRINRQEEACGRYKNSFLREILTKKIPL